MNKWALRAMVAGAAIAGAGVTLRAQDMGGSAMPATPAPIVEESAPAQMDESRPARIVQPWRQIESLSDDQKRQIHQIHRDALQQIRQIRVQEREQILAILSDEQKAELKALEDEQATERKLRAAARRNGSADEQNESPDSDDDHAEDSSGM